MSDPLLVLDRTVDVYRRLQDAGIGCAVGGALCLAYHVDDPRGTQDIDLNISLPSTRAEEALRALPADVPWDDETLEAIRRDDQVRILWPIADAIPMPLDLFFAVAPFHDVASRRTVRVPMRGSTVEILSATDLAVLKALFARTKDWADIEAMLDAHDSSVDLAEAIAWVADIVGATDPRTQRLGSMIHRAR